MLLFASKMGVHWYFLFAVKTANNRNNWQNITLSKSIEQHNHICVVQFIFMYII